MTLSPEQTLSIWEQGIRRHPIDRALLLFALARPDLSAESLADRPLGDCNAALLKFQRESFRSRMSAWVECLACGDRMEFDLDSAQLPAPRSDNSDAMQIDGITFKLPTSRHLSQLALLDIDPDKAARQLFLTCALDMKSLPNDEPALMALLEQVETAMEEADPWAHIALDLQCPSCGDEDMAEFDIARFLWNELEIHTQRLLNDIHMLAQAYGWTEAEILRLSDSRRAAYLTRITGPASRRIDTPPAHHETASSGALS